MFPIVERPAGSPGARARSRAQKQAARAPRRTEAAPAPGQQRRRRRGLAMGGGDRRAATAATASAPGSRRRSLSPRLRPRAELSPPLPWRAAPRRPPPTALSFSAQLAAATPASGSGSRRGHASTRGIAEEGGRRGSAPSGQRRKAARKQTFARPRPTPARVRQAPPHAGLLPLHFSDGPRPLAWARLSPLLWKQIFFPGRRALAGPAALLSAPPLPGRPGRR